MFVLLVVQQVSIRKYHLVHHLCVPSRSRGFAGHISISNILRRSLVQSTYVRYIGTVLWSKTKNNVPRDLFLTEPSVDEN
jgi:hypothetical protein